MKSVKIESGFIFGFTLMLGLAAGLVAVNLGVALVNAAWCGVAEAMGPEDTAQTEWTCTGPINSIFFR